MNVQPFSVSPRAYPQPLSVIGVKVTVLAAKDATQGYEITVQEGDEGAGPPPHSHPWNESFYVIRGSVTFRYGDQAVTGEPGTLVHVPADSVHSFAFGPGGGAMLEISGPGGAATRMFTSLHREVPPGPPDIPKVIGILQRHGLTVHA